MTKVKSSAAATVTVPVKTASPTQTMMTVVTIPEVEIGIEEMDLTPQDQLDQAPLPLLH